MWLSSPHILFAHSHARPLLAVQRIAEPRRRPTVSAREISTSTPGSTYCRSAPLRCISILLTPIHILSCHSVWEDSGDEEDEDAPVLAVDTANTYLRARCGKYTAGTAAAQAGVNIVNKLWLDSGKDCRYATRQFSSDVQSALNAEFPNNCRDTGAVSAFVDRVSPHHLSLDTNAVHPILNSSTPTQVASDLARIT